MFEPPGQLGLVEDFLANPENQSFAHDSLRFLGCNKPDASLRLSGPLRRPWKREARRLIAAYERNMILLMSRAKFISSRKAQALTLTRLSNKPQSRCVY